LLNHSAGSKSLTAAELEVLSARTLAHYDASAQSFQEGTRTHDVSQNYAALLGAIEGPPPFTLLDFGCGPGRDLAYFRSLGHEAVGLDGSARFVEMARAVTGLRSDASNLPQSVAAHGALSRRIRQRVAFPRANARAFARSGRALELTRISWGLVLLESARTGFWQTAIPARSREPMSNSSKITATIMAKTAANYL